MRAGLAYSQEALTWKECVRRAKDNNPDLISAGERLKQSKADKDISLSSALPQVSSEISGKRSRSADKKPADSYGYGITGRQLVFDGFKTSSEISSALKAIRAQEYNYAVESSNVRLDLRASFTGLMKAQELVHITESIEERRRQNLELVKLRYESGREHKGALLTAEADMAQAEFETAQAKRNVLLSQRDLSRAMGLTRAKPLMVKGKFSLTASYKNRPDIDFLAESTPFLRELIERKEAARYNVSSREADFLPKVYLNGSLGRTDNEWPPENREWSAGFSVSLPIFEGGRRLAEAAKAESQLNQAKAAERSGRDSVLVTLERTWKELQDGIEAVSVQKKFLEAAEERAAITRAQYETGLASFNDWIIIEDNLVKAKKAYLNTQADMLLAEAYWIQATGGTLEYDQE